MDSKESMIQLNAALKTLVDEYGKLPAVTEMSEPKIIYGVKHFYALRAIYLEEKIGMVLSMLCQVAIDKSDRIYTWEELVLKK